MSVRPFRPTGQPVNSRGGRFGGLDGLRAIAVGMVLVYHLFPKALPGGFLGVDVFFVMSGFLITSLLLRELESTGRIDLLAFWRRRARRLLPAVALVVLVSTSLALAASRDLLVGVAQQIAGAVFFVSNWVFIANGSDYFARDAPELFRNFWSLALEEQFYIVLPIIAILVFRLRSRLTWAIPLAALGLGSAFLMAQLAHTGADPTRIYFGSDSHSFGLFLGAAMAVVLSRASQRALGKAGQAASLVVALLGFAVLGALAIFLKEASQESFIGGFQLATIAALAVVWAITREGAIVGRALDVTPLRWIGERSYGIYLWHWPLLVIVTSIATAAGFGKSWLVPVITLTLTILFSALSYRFVEQPVRRVGLRGALIRWFSPRSYTPRRKKISIGLAAVIAVTFPLTGVAVAIAPQQTSSAESILRGQKMLEADRAKPAADGEGGGGADSGSGLGSGSDPKSTDVPSGVDKGNDDKGSDDKGNDDKASDAGKGAAPKSGDAKDADAGKSGDSKGTDAQGGDAKGSDAKGTDAGKGTATGKKPAPAPVKIEGRDITAVGDSVMLASYPELTEAFPGIEVDAAVSRGLWAGVDILSDMAAQGTLREVVVVGLGTNGPVEPEALSALQEAVGARALVLVDAHAERDWIPEVNETLTGFASTHRSVTLAKWDEAVGDTPEYLAEDGIHPGPEGGMVYAGAVRKALDELLTPGEATGWAVGRR
ncbi:acyltransferase family protein [Leucobacter sp. BZR 635]